MPTASSADFRTRQQDKRQESKGITTSPIQVETVTRAWFNTNQESKYYYVPSLIATMLFIFSMLLTSIGIVREKEIGTIEQVMVTPIRGLEFILGKTIPYMITGYISMTIMLCVAYLVFGVHVKGSLLLLYVLSGLYLCGNMGIALIISVSAQTQQQALLTSFLLLMPCVMLSGFMFPITNMPEPIQVRHLAESDALVSGDPSRHRDEKRRHPGPLAGDPGPDGLVRFLYCHCSSSVQKDALMKSLIQNQDIVSRRACLPQCLEQIFRKNPDNLLLKEVPMPHLFLTLILILLLPLTCSSGETGPEQIFTLSEALQTAFANNPSLREADLTHSSTLAEVRRTQADFFVKASAHYSLSNLQDAPFQQISGNRMQVGDRDVHHWDVTLTQPLFTGFAITSRYQMARISAEIKGLEKERTLLDVSQAVKTAWFTSLLADKTEKVATNTVTALTAHEKDAEGFFKHGVIPQNDLLKSKVALANAIQEKERAHAGTQIALARLYTLIGIDINSVIIQEDTETISPAAPGSSDPHDRGHEQQPGSGQLSIRTGKS